MSRLQDGEKIDRPNGFVLWWTERPGGLGLAVLPCFTADWDVRLVPAPMEGRHPHGPSGACPPTSAARRGSAACSITSRRASPPQLDCRALRRFWRRAASHCPEEFAAIF